MGVLDYTVTFTFRPLRAILRAVQLGLLLALAMLPMKLGHTPLEPTPQQVALDTRVELIVNELAPRMQPYSEAVVRDTARAIVVHAEAAGYDPLWVLAVIEAESGFDVEACSPAKAKGLMQLLPSTFAMVSSGRIFDPVDNVKAGIAYLALLGKTFTRPETILMAYNGGPKRASRYVKAVKAKEDTSVFPEEMRTYPSKVMKKYTKLLVKNGKDPKQAKKLFKSQPSTVYLASR